MHFFPFTPRAGSRARTRGSVEVCSAVAELDIATTCSDFILSRAARVVAVKGISALALPGLATPLGDKSAFVNGVESLIFREPADACMLLES